VLQQLEHPVSADLSVNDCFRPVSRFFDRISRPEQLLTALPEAMRVLTDPAETGAVTLSLPQDIQAHAYDYPTHFFTERIWPIARRSPESRQIAAAVALLKAAKRPVIIAGGGVHYADAGEALRAFAEACGIPVTETSGGKGAMPGDAPLLLGGSGVNGTPAAAQIVRDADLVIAIGTRLTDFTTGSQSAFQHPDVRFIAINVCPHDAYKQGALPVVGDARETLVALAKAATGITTDAAYRAEIVTAKDAWAKQLRDDVFVQAPGEAMSQGQLIGTLNRAARAGDTVIAAAGGAPGDLLKLWDTTGGRHLHLEFGFSCMGYELPAGIGVRIAQPEGEVYVLIGDGTYLMNPSELVTALQERLKVTVIIAENHGYQVIRQLQMNRAGRSFGNEFRARDDATHRLEGNYVTIDFAQNAASMGARTWHVATPDALEMALMEARDESRSCVIVVETEPHRYLPGAGVWWDVAPAEATNDPVTDERRTAYENERAQLQRFYY
ncbi:MAG TPA: thiamine pyrophosphate-dependent enzyme, partial [Thermomicrobiales bacterium]